MKYVQIITTTDKIKIADKITNSLLKKKLASCVQRLPIQSTYRWKGKIENSKEFLLLIKTKKSLYKKVEKEIKANHDYEVPEILEIPITNGNKAYLNWLNSETL